MKKIHLLALPLISLVITSCQTINYQVYEVKSSTLTQKDNSMVYENDDCEIFYNLWTENGSMSYIFKNKTDKDIFIDMSQTFFIKNGKAFDYYMARTFEDRTYEAVSIGYSYGVSKGYALSGDWWPYQYTASVSKSYGLGKTVSAKTGISSAVTKKEKEFICIPAKSYKYVEGYRIYPSFEKTCDKQLDYPKTESTLITYSEGNSPLKFNNRIAYSFEESSKSLKFIENSFWLSSVKNYTKKMAIEKVKVEGECKYNKFDDKGYTPKVEVFKIGGPNQFYVPYKVFK